MEHIGEHTFYGVHILGELHGVQPELLDDMSALVGAMEKGIQASGATLCSLQRKQFEPSGLTLLALLSESHASIHTYPEQGSLFFDAFTCGERCQPLKIAEAFLELLKPTEHSLRTVHRGQIPFLKREQTA